jgi:carbamoyl-phosphate synthase large subunit
VLRVREALVDPDPVTRRAAVFVASEQRLGPYLDLLVERSRLETDDAVRDALAEIVLRNQWAAAESTEMVELRLWAQAHVDRQPPARTSAPPPPYEPPPPAYQPPPAPSQHQPLVPPPATPGPTPGRAEPRTFLAGGPDQTAMAGPRLATDPIDDASTGGITMTWGDADEDGRGLRPVRWAPGSVARGGRRPGLPGIIVTGAGGAAGVAVIRILVATGHRVVGVDMDGMAAGLRLAHEAALVPSGDDPTFVSTLCQLAVATGAGVLISTVSEELIALAESADELAEAGLTTWLPEPGPVSISTDKWRLAQLMREKGLPAPACNLGSGDGVPGSWVVKPRFGRGSKDVHFVDRPTALQWVLLQVPEPLVQTRLSGREFTVDALVDRHGDLSGAVPRWRLETKAGISTKGRTFANKDLTEAVGDVLSAIGLRGPANVQGFIEADGTPWFIDVNPRFSGGLPLSVAAGADLVGEYVRAILGEPIREEHLSYRPGVTMIRHFEEIFE